LPSAETAATLFCAVLVSGQITMRKVEEAGRLGNVPLVPGTPVEACILMGHRTALSYLMKPLRDQTSRRCREK
jgi:hypothetical protein